MNRTSILCFALAIAVLAAGISHVVTLRYSYARHERAFREIPAIAHPPDIEAQKDIRLYKIRRGWFTTEDLLTGIGASIFIALVFASNGWSHHRRLKHGKADPAIKLILRICAWLLLGFILLALFAH